MNAQAETRLETLTEATETLFSALLDARGTVGAKARDRHEVVVGAREEYKAALAAFLMPVFRVVEGGLAGQEQMDSEFKCKKCGAVERCELGCAHWHATIKAKIDTADETFPTCTVCDQPDDPSILCCEKTCPRRQDNGSDSA